ncbi:hypothetical protein EMCRGX_G012357 [Ephydatia muelleri]
MQYITFADTCSDNLSAVDGPGLNKTVWFWMEHHITKVKERCRVCGRFLVEPREKKTRAHTSAKSLQLICTLINTSNDMLTLTLLASATFANCIVPLEWKPHTAVDCGICHPKPLRDKTSPPCGRPAKQSPQKIIAGIQAIAPPTESLQDDHLLGSSNNPAIPAVSHMPEDFTPASGAPIGVKCPCCFHDTPITAPQLKAAPLLIQTLLRDIVLQCQTCRKDIKACDQLRFPLEEHPITFMHITQAHTPTKTASARTIKRRCMQMQNIREVAGIVSAIGPGEALAIKAGLGMPWSKLRVLRRWLKASGVSISCEEKMRQIARGLLGENLHKGK